MVHRRQSIFSTIFSLFINTLAFLFNFIFLYLLIHQYGTSFAGFSRFTVAFLAFFGSSEGSLGIVTVLFLIKPIMEKDYQRVNEILFTAKKQYLKLFIYCIIAITGILLIFILYFYILHLGSSITVLNPNTSTSSVLPIWGMAIIIFSFAFKNLLSYTWTSVYENLLQSDQNNYINRLILLISDLIIYSVLFFLMNKGYLPELIFMIFIFYSLLKSCLIQIYVKIKYPWINYENVDMDDQLIYKTKKISVYNISIKLLYNIDLLIALILLGFESVSVLSLYLIIVWAFRNIASGFIYSFKEYFATISNSVGRIGWNGYQNLEKYTIGLATFTFIFQFLFAPYILNALFSNLLNTSLITSPTSEVGISQFFQDVFTSTWLSFLLALQTLIFLLTQSADVMIYAKKYYSQISKFNMIFVIISILVTLIIGLIIKYTIGSTSYITILYGITISFVVFMALEYGFMYYHVWSKLTYNSNLKNIIPNLTVIILSITSAILFQNLYIATSHWNIIWNSTNLYWQNWQHLLKLLLITFGYASINIVVILILVWPNWLAKLFRNSIFISFLLKIRHFKNNKKSKKTKKSPLFLKNLQGVYTKFDNDKLIPLNTINNSHPKKEVYTLENLDNKK